MPSSNASNTYDPDGECLENSLNKIAEYFNIDFDKSQVSLILNNKNVHLIDLFKKSSLNVSGFYSKISLINPFNWTHFFRFRKLIKFQFQKSYQESIDSDNVCVLMHFSFFSLYGISGPWHHYIVYYRDNEKFVAHDELREKLNLEFKNLRAQMSYEEAWLAASTKIVIWK